ncbi:deoxyribose-phosphate aldolase [Methanocella conradii HZ254]|uniref:Deoxyribose-phosphate aldolase n=1 Tax=Methanocella conradii (strain DSM 24694 / JCM 17849 / CGMCC 1.5162 / HZ254) TaxID=1041930 RepID=H8I6L4_METCZ|nr:deoxyribose-phosphate aldolase [Methanocella conradii]AFC98906.1 deoxyribose-phosphate aldolase [Methanocella conradii HZ254]MDI6897240.1 deoxyribose-phosphate aldolase [Methanocella conradii]
MNAREFARHIDHTLLRPDATEKDILRLCEEAKLYGFASACVASCWVGLARDRLRGSNVKACCVVGFPLGSEIYHAKAFEAREAVHAGAEEIDVVMNIGYFKSGRTDYVRMELEEIIAASKGATVKVIIETCYLTDAEKVEAARLARDAGAPYVKTSTGYGSMGATVEDVRLIKKEVPGIMIKASGGIRTYEDAKRLLDAGATRIGTSSAVKIMEELKALQAPK